MTGGRMMGDGMMDGMGIFLFGFVLVIALLVFAVIAGAILLVRALWKPQQEPPSAGDRATTSPAFDILEQRYARGEIDDDEFERRRQALSRR